MALAVMAMMGIGGGSGEGGARGVRNGRAFLLALDAQYLRSLSFHPPDFPSCLKTIHLWHLAIHQNRIIRGVPESMEGFLSVLREFGMVP